MSNSIIMKMFIEANKTIKSADSKMIVCYPVNDSLGISYKSDDGLFYSYLESKDKGYMFNEFSVRDWSLLERCIGLINPENENHKFTIGVNENDYPNKITIQLDDTKIIHYLQCYEFISSQEEILNNYKQRKFKLSNQNAPLVNGISKQLLQKLGRLGTILGEKDFSIKVKDGSLIFAIGDDTITVDNASIVVDENCDDAIKTIDGLFSIESFVKTVNNFNCENMEIKIIKDMIMICGDNNVCTKVVCIKPKRV